jgi:hypothetical protein
VRHVLTGLQHTQIARTAAPELVEWRTQIRGPDLRTQRREAAFKAELATGVIDPSSDVGPLADVRRAEADERARARAALALTVWPR